MSEPATLEAKPGAQTELDNDVSFLDEMISGQTHRSTDKKPEKKPAEEKKPDDKKPDNVETTDKKPPVEGEGTPKDEGKPKKCKPAAATAPLPPQPAPVDYEKIAEASGRGAAAALSKANEKKAPSETDLMTESERDQYAVIQRMEKEFTKFAGKAKEFADSIQRAGTYQQQWEKDNPGKPFNPDDSEHDAFYQKNDVQLDDHFYNRTLARIEAEQLLEKKETKESKRIGELEAREKVRDAEPLIAAAAEHARRSYYAMAGEEFAKADPAELKRIVDADPTKAVVVQMANSVPLFAADLHKLTNGLESFDDKNPKHRFIADFAERQQQTVKGMAPAEQAELAKKLNRADAAGTVFITADEYNSLPTAQRSRYWRLSETDLAVLYAAEQAALAQQSLADEENRWEAIAKARGYQKVNGTPTPPVAPAKPSETPPEQRPHVNSPAATVAPMSAHAAGNKDEPQKNKTDSFLNDWLR